MGWYIGKRLLAALVTVWIVATAGFLLIEIIPGDPARQLAGPGASAETLAAIREAYGFDDPLPVRYVDSLARMAQGDLGYSFAKAEPVTQVLLRSLPPTLLLTGLAFLVEVLIAIPLALWVVSRGGWADRLLVILAGLTAAVPAFLVGLLLIYVFAFRLRLFPLGGAGTPAAYVLPVLTLGVPFGLVLARLLRTSLLEQQEQPYITFSAALGESPWSVRWRHLLPNALLPLLSILALRLRRPLLQRGGGGGGLLHARTGGRPVAGPATPGYGAHRGHRHRRRPAGRTRQPGRRCSSDQPRPARPPRDLVRVVRRKMAGHRMPLPTFAELGHRLRTARLCEWAAHAKHTARGWPVKATGLGPGLAPPLAAARGSQESPRVGMARPAEDSVAAAGLDDASTVHDRDTPAQVADDRKVVRDEEIADAALRLEVQEQVQDLALDGHIEGGDGLVTDDQVGLKGKRTSDTDTLQLAPREGGRPPATQDGVDTHPF